MVFSTCCLVLSGGALANDYSFDSPVDADITASTFSLKSSASVEPVALATIAGGFTMTSNKPISYGISGGLHQTWTSGASYDGDHYTLASYDFTDTSGSSYISIPVGTYIDLNFDVSGAYPDVEQIDLWGTFDGNLGVWYPGGLLTVKPNKCSLLVNGQVVSTYTQTDVAFRYTHSLNVGDSVQTVGIRFYYPEHFDLGAFGDPFGSRWLLLWQHDFNTNVTQSQQGFFNSLFSWLGNIRDGISNVASSISTGFGNLLNAVTSLPSKIADAIRGLFVPTDAQMNELKASFNSLLSEKLGFVYQSVSLVDGVFVAVFDAVDNPDSDVSFAVPAFPSFNVAGTEVSLWDNPIHVDIADNEVVQTVQQVASPFVVAVLVWGFVHSMEDAFLAFVGGKSLADWVRNRKEEAE